jgi:hypothetical protein
MERMKNVYKILFGKSEGRDYSENLGIDDRIILERLLGTKGGKVWIECICIRIAASGGLF